MSRGSSISERLTRMNLLVSGTVLLLAAVAFFSYDLLSYRQNLLRNLDAEAEIVGENSVSAITFNDPQSAAATLASLQQSADVLSTALLSNSGSLFASSGPSIQDEVRSHPLAPEERVHTWAFGRQVLLAHRIIFQGKPVGVVYILATLTEIGQRARQYALIAVAILMLCMVAGVFVGTSSRRLIAEPIAALADTALRVSRDQDYAIRADAHSNSNEIAILVDAFNAMLARIEERTAAVIEARNELEVRVEERTAELQAANRELEAFSYTVAHDLRGPLDAVNGIIFLLTQPQSGPGDPAFRAMLDQLEISTRNMGLLIDDLLNFARAATVDTKTAPVNLSAIVRELAAELAASGPGRKVSFQIAEVPEVYADAGLMRIVLDNLLRNAWKYTLHHAEACIEFGVRLDVLGDAEPGNLIYFVRDDGAGFDPNLTDQLFQPFQRLHSKADFPGTGIGLATVSRIIHRMGGRIWAEGAVEKGATFYFTLG